VLHKKREFEILRDVKLPHKMENWREKTIQFEKHPLEMYQLS